MVSAAAKKAAGVIVSPIALFFVIVWTILGMFLDPSRFQWTSAVVFGATAALYATASGTSGNAVVVTSAALVAQAVILILHWLGPSARTGSGTSKYGITVHRRWSVPLAFLLLIALVLLESLLPADSGRSSSGVSGSADAAGVRVGCILLTVLHFLRLTHVWRPASPQGAVKAEKAILSAACKTPFVQKTVAGMHTVIFGSPSSSSSDKEGAADERPTLVFAHGYGAGSALFLHNFDAFAAEYRVVSIDWLGCAASDRPVWPVPSPSAAKPGSGPASAAAAERFFLSALEAWRQEMGLESFVLMGHSLGGLLAAAYCMAYPGRVSHLVLVSPAGIPVPPPDSRTEPPKANGGMVRSIPNSPTPRPIPRMLWRVASYLWERDATPGALLRWIGPLARTVARAGLRGRASRWVLAVPIAPYAQDLGDYMFHCTASDSSGEYALNALLAPGVWARSPIGPRLIAAAQRPAAPPGVVPGGDSGVASDRLTCPVLFVYGGSHDWMSAPAGAAVAAELVKAGVPSKVLLPPLSGHHVYLEAAPTFNAWVLAELRAWRKGVAEAPLSPPPHVRAPAPAAATPSSLTMADVLFTPDADSSSVMGKRAAASES